MDKALIIGTAALIVNFIGYVPYIKGIVEGKVRPQRITWGIWSILTLIAFINQLVNGGGWSSLFFGSTTALVIVVFALSLRKGVGGGSRFDKLILVTAAVLFVYWAFSKDTYYSTLIAVAIDGIGALPTVVKAYRSPHTEAYLQWLLAAVAGLLSMLAVPAFWFILVVYPAYVVVMNSVIVVAKYVGTKRALR